MVTITMSKAFLNWHFHRPCRLLYWVWQFLKATVLEWKQAISKWSIDLQNLFVSDWMVSYMSWGGCWPFSIYYYVLKLWADNISTVVHASYGKSACISSLSYTCEKSTSLFYTIKNFYSSTVVWVTVTVDLESLTMTQAHPYTCGPPPQPILCSELCVGGVVRQLLCQANRDSV